MLSLGQDNFRARVKAQFEAILLLLRSFSEIPSLVVLSRSSQALKDNNWSIADIATRPIGAQVRVKEDR